MRSLPTEAKADSLFDNIHNLLEHPHKLKLDHNYRRYSGDAIKLLHLKMNQLNKQLGQDEAGEAEKEEKVGGEVTMKGSRSVSRNEILQKTVTEWKRLEYRSGSNFKCHLDSNFEKEVERIGSLQDRNNDYLTRLIDQQKKLVELNYLSKLKPASTVTPT